MTVMIDTKVGKIIKLQREIKKLEKQLEIAVEQL